MEFIFTSLCMLLWVYCYLIMYVFYRLSLPHHICLLWGFFSPYNVCFLRIYLYLIVCLLWFCFYLTMYLFYDFNFTSSCMSSMVLSFTSLCMSSRWLSLPHHVCLIWFFLYLIKYVFYGSTFNSSCMPSANWRKP